MTAIWPLFDLHITTPRLTLLYVTDNLGEQLAELAGRGIHHTADMPFSEPWTDVEAPELQRNTVRYYWRCRAETTADRWTLNLAASDCDGQLIGLCTLSAEQFPTSRSATTGSWLGQSFQRLGYGREMRQAALHLLFAGFDGETAGTRAWHDNTASLGVTRALPYTETGVVQEPRRGHPEPMLEFAMTKRQWQTIRRDDIRLHGVRPVRTLLGISG